MTAKLFDAATVFAEGKVNPLEMGPDLAVFTLVAFLILLGILYFFAWPQIIGAINAREQMVADSIESAEQAAKKSEALLQEYQARISAAGEEATRLVGEAKRDAESAKGRILQEASEEADRQRNKAISEIRAAKDLAVQELAQKSVDSAVSLAGNLIGEKVDAKMHQKLITEALDRFETSKN